MSVPTAHEAVRRFPRIKPLRFMIQIPSAGDNNHNCRNQFIFSPAPRRIQFTTYAEDPAREDDTQLTLFLFVNSYLESQSLLLSEWLRLIFSYLAWRVVIVNVALEMNVTRLAKFGGPLVPGD